MPARGPNPRKLLVASVGVATINYLGSACSSTTSSTVANLMAPPHATDGGTKDAALDARKDAAPRPTSTTPAPPPTIANLMAPAPQGQGKEGNR
jgi:hypothetical protein